ncbi:MAG: 50S ribosomal protein L4 [Bacilli bacterium]
MSKVAVMDLSGKKLRDHTLAPEVFAININSQAMFDAVVMQQASSRQGTHDVKNRSEVRGGGRKPWRQKGTGRARQGSIRSPQWKGGGVVFGPTPRSYKYNLNRKVRRLALKSALSTKVLDKQVMIVENLVLDSFKTKDFVVTMANLNLQDKTLFVVDGNENWENAFLAMRNLPNVMLLMVEELNVYDIVNATTLVFTEAAAKLAGEVWI